MSLKLSAALLVLFFMSGCCQIFGLCTSVSVHTSADAADKYARGDANSYIGSNATVKSNDTILIGSTNAGPLTRQSDLSGCTQKSG